jgi:putative phosphoribosyl transferase
MYYFPNRTTAGNLIADQLEPKYRYDDCAVLALGDGAVMVGTAIAARLHCVINMLLCSAIQLPRETEVLASIDNFGGLTFNNKYSPGELEEIQAEFFSYIEQQKLQKLFEMNELLGAGGVLSTDQLRNRVVVVVSDGLTNGFSMLADEIICLNVIEDVISIDHYYDDNTLPPHEAIVRILEDIVLLWK